jgi:hypothetical protein
MPAVVVNPRTKFKYGLDNAYGGGESAVLDIINVQSVVVNLEIWPKKILAAQAPRVLWSFSVLPSCLLPSAFSSLQIFGIIFMLRCPVSPRSSLSSLLYPTLPYSLIVSRARR